MKRFFKKLERKSNSIKLPKLNLVRCNMAAFFLTLFIPTILLINIIFLNQSLIRPEYNKFLCGILIVQVIYLLSTVIANSSKNGHMYYKYLYRSYLILTGSFMMVLAVSFFNETGSLFYFFISMLFFSIVPLFSYKEFVVTELITVGYLISLVAMNSKSQSMIVQVVLFDIVRLVVTAWKYQVSINNIELKRRLIEEKDIADKDHLTGMLNRRGLNRKLCNIWPVYQRNKLSCGAIMLDIDFFKKYNDNYGHPAGDECLSKVAKLIRNTTRRNTDLIARIGGEEFIVFVQDADKSDLVFLSKKIQRCIEDENIEHSYSSVAGHVTVSIGLAYIKNARDKDYLSIYKMADKSLYKAKQSGRNCIAYGDNVISKVKKVDDSVYGKFDEYMVKKA